MTTPISHHPDHVAIVHKTGEPAQPLRASWVLQWRLERACRKRGGHWWHFDPISMIGWFCCQCGAEQDGMPKDGS